MALCIYGQRAGWPRWLAVLLAVTLLCFESVNASANPHNNVSVETAEALRPLRDIYAVVAAKCRAGCCASNGYAARGIRLMRCAC